LALSAHPFPPVGPALLRIRISTLPRLARVNYSYRGVNYRSGL
jgi:hypothetical protein